MRPVPNPLTQTPDLGPLDIRVTEHARYRLNERHFTISDIVRVLKGENVVRSDVAPDGRVRYISRSFEGNRELLNVVWQLDGRMVTVISVYFGTPEFR
jgi:hypothetical protein